MKTQNISRFLALASIVVLFGACTNSNEMKPELKSVEEMGVSQPTATDASAPQSVEGTTSSSTSTGSAASGDTANAQVPSSTPASDVNGAKKQ